MKRLLDAFSTLFDLDHRVRGTALGDLVASAVNDLEQRPLPDWGSPGPREFVSVGSDSFDFYYAPHLLPKMDLDLRLAHKLQFHMLPLEVPADAPLSLAAVLESYCHLSGDLFGWEMLADGKFLIWIVDLSGHGTRAGLASAMLKVLIDNLRQRSLVGSMVTELNESFISCLQEDRGSLFATGFFMAVAPDGTACYTSAGHPPVMLRKHDGRLVELPSNGVPIGMFPGRRYMALKALIEPGDTLLLHTDGVVETTNKSGEQFSLDRLRDFMRTRHDSPRSLTQSLFRAISDYQDMDKLDDDVTFVAGRMGGQLREL